jgi:two-component system chemotaxis response regulator CheY
MRALIVDDSRFIRNLLRGLLQAIGFECAEAGNGEDALGVLKASQPFDIALVDWNMPVMNGLEFVKQMRAAGFGDAKVLMVTTEGENEFILRALDAGADEYLMKPFDGEALNEKLAMLGLLEDSAPFLAKDATEA